MHSTHCDIEDVIVTLLPSGSSYSFDSRERDDDDDDDNDNDNASSKTFDPLSITTSCTDILSFTICKFSWDMLTFDNLNSFSRRSVICLPPRGMCLARCVKAYPS